MLPSELVAQVKRIQLQTGRQVADVLAGAYLSVFKGRGMEFEEVRPYVPGDDVRTIDWNVTARMGEPYVKRFVEERELTVLLMVDVSASQEFGSHQRSKRAAAVELSALVAFSANYNNDKVGLLLFHGGVEKYIPPRKGQKHTLRVIREVLAHDTVKPPLAHKPIHLSQRVATMFRRLRKQTRTSPDRATNIAHAIEFCRNVVPRRVVLFLISDFLDTGYLDTLRSANRKHDVVSVLVTDQRELKFEKGGLITLQDAETGSHRLVDTSSAEFRKAIETHSEARIQALTGKMRSSGIDIVQVDASRPVVDPLLAFFRMRQRRLRL